MSKIRNKIDLYSNIYGRLQLKRWSLEEGFIVEYEHNTEGGSSEIIATGKTVKDCMKSLFKEESYNSKSLFSVWLSNEIIETFELSQEDIGFLTELGERGDF